MKKIVFLLTLVLILFFLGKSLNPFSSTMFNFHDETQPARIKQFSMNINNLKIPPRLAPDFSFKMGYPVFNYYAPFSYWLTSGLNLFGFDVVNSLKISFLLLLISAFTFSYLFFRNFFSYYSSLIGSVFYATSLYFAIDIFIRGNLAESWFLALMPLALHFLYKNSTKHNPLIFLFTVFALSAVFTTHNILSPIFLIITLFYILLLQNKKLNFYAVVLSVLLSGYFFIPLILESNLVYAKEVAKSTNFHDHFLCINQLWQSSWGYGGSVSGCENDGMPFKIGKPQLILFFLGIFIFLWQFINKKFDKNNKLSIFFLVLTLVSLFLTTYQSSFIWNLFSPVFSLFQFPWRFISFSLLGIAFFVSVFYENIPLPWKNLIIIITIPAIIIINGKYFYKLPMSKTEFEKNYLSEKYISSKAAYQIAEYLPKTVDYQYWRTFKKDKKTITAFNIDTPWYKEITTQKADNIILNIHYFPFWKIYIDKNLYVPENFDQLGRPIIKINYPSAVKIIYQETLYEKSGNIVSILTLIFLLLITFNKNLWNRILKYLK